VEKRSGHGTHIKNGGRKGKGGWGLTFRCEKRRDFGCGKFKGDPYKGKGPKPEQENCNGSKQKTREAEEDTREGVFIARGSKNEEKDCFKDRQGNLLTKTPTGRVPTEREKTGGN